MDKLAYLSGKEDTSQLQGSKLGSYIEATNLFSCPLTQLSRLQRLQNPCAHHESSDHAARIEKDRVVETYERARGFM